jgi:alkylation response protein AidB-like acyl-CoA dehydrogenase
MLYKKREKCHARWVDRYELRRQDYSLSEDHIDLQSAYRQFLQTRCPIETVRAAETSGFDKGLWERLCAMGATTMALPESCGGDAATLVDLTLVAEEVGRSLAPVPWIDHVCATRLLARLGALGGDADGTGDLVSGEQIAGLDPQIDGPTGVRLIPTGSIADHIIVRDGEQIVRLSFDTRPARVDNIGRLPMAWVDPAGADRRTVLARGADALANYQQALAEWRLLTAAALVGLVEETMTIAAEFAKTRYTLGVPISTLQAVSHPLANMAIAVQGGRSLAHRAAWFLDNEPDERPELALSAFVFMSEEAAKSATMAVHIQGGLGVSAEAAATAYLVRARGWPLAGGDPGASAKRIAEIVADRETRDRTAPRA